MTRQTLIHLTDDFPYGTGENFSAIELQHLATEFDTVLTIPVRLGQDPGPPRETPRNVHVYDRANPFTSFSAAQHIAKIAWFGLTQLASHPLTTLRRVLKAPKPAALDIAFEALTHAVTSEVLNWLSHPEIKRHIDGSLVTIYSTWFHLDAAVAVQLTKTELSDQIVKTVSRAHGYDLYPERNRWMYLPWRPELLAGLDHVMPVSRDGSNYLRATYPQYKDKVSTRHLGSLPAGERATPTQKPFAVITTSWITPVKRLELVIDALRVLHSRSQAFHWYHVGTAGESTGAQQYGARLQAYAEQQLPADSFTFYGQVPNQNILETYRSLGGSVLLNTSSSEGVPVALMEAMSIGMPIIATDVGGTRDLYSEKMLRWLLPSDPSPTAVADRLSSLALIPAEDYRSACNAAYTSWDLAWNADRNYAEFVRFLREGH